MWACLQDHDTANHWKQVAGWRKVCDLAQTHLGRLQQYRRGLAEAWPPETSAASRTYLAELDELIDKVQRTHDAAAANYTALSAATQAIATTRAALRKIHEEYATKFQQKQAYESIAADPKAVMGNRSAQPPVSDGELERLNVQARSMMFNLSGELQQAQATLQKPPAAPKINPGIDQSDPNVYGGTPAPVIPPVIAVPLPTSPTTRPSASASQGLPSTSLGVGPVLGGTGNTIAPGSPPSIPPTGTTPPVVSGPTLGVGAPSVPPVISSPRDASGVSRLPRSATPPANTAGSAGNPAAQPRPMPPGGLIGGMPGMGLGSPPAGGGAPLRRINPVGGLIGGGGAGTGPTGGAGSRPGSGRGLNALQGTPPFGFAPGIGQSPSGAAPPRPGIRMDADAEKRPWDPDNPWITDEGVAPIVRPPQEEGPIDPGPAIGIDR
ncbi:hypothetical protein EV382_5948 [Micromonospora violae]|uniref:PPE family protein n=1 Tax=Micromonospora violae TaxID=1278207 RepID=A0A4Q7UPR9_9ACTN|nr:hypothetical protein EV382_5948 [Micromonospora violae]